LQNNYEFTDRDFFKDRFSRAEIEELLRGKPASEMFNFKSPGFKKLGLNKDSLSDDELIDLMLNEPRLVRRPVVRINDNVYFGANQAVLEKALA
jgi:arsenate reductase-like glutaredoxin family protein